MVKNIIVERITSNSTEMDELLIELDDYFNEKKININSHLMNKAINLLTLFNKISFIAIKINGEYECIYITSENLEL